MYKVADIQQMRKARGMTQEQVGILAGMSNFLSHEYGDVIINTVKTHIPELQQTTVTIRQDLVNGKLDSFFPE